MVDLYDKVYGCLAAVRVASAMGAPVETFSRERIEAVYGFIDCFHPYEHYGERGIRWERAPGTTEDGIERQNLLCRAIVAKQGRITCQDLARTMLEHSDADKMLYTSMPEDIKTLEFLRVGVPEAEAGYLCDRIARNGLARAGQPIGLINAGNPEGAARDCFDVGRIWFGPRDLALIWASVYVAAVAEALKPDATIESTVAAGLALAPSMVKLEIQRAIGVAARASGREELYSGLEEFYDGSMVWTYVLAPETVSKAFAVFVHARGDVKEAILTAINLGRDTDCLGAMAAGLTGALSGAVTLPGEWVEQVDTATAMNPYTNTDWTVKQHADGTFAVLKSRGRRMREQLLILEG